jgi:ribose/xylose/arabinose/galactoside ABC-type transport system permease subunit
MDSMNSRTDEITPAITEHYKVPFNFRRFLRANSAQLGILGVFITLWIIFIILAPKTFLAPRIYSAFMASIPFFAIMAIPLTIIVIAGEMDLSFPSIMAMGMVAFNFIHGATAFLHNETLQVYHCQVWHPLPCCHHRHTILMAGCGSGAYTGCKFLPGIY